MKLFLLAVTTILLITTGCRTNPTIDNGRNFPIGTPSLKPYDDGFSTPGGPNIIDGTGGSDLNVPAEGTGDDRYVPGSLTRWAGCVVYFSYDKYSIGVNERRKLQVLSKHLKEHSNYCVIIEGHCDERGSDEYNRALGEKRALSIKDYLISDGIDGNRIDTVSYGEDKPIIPNATTEAEHCKNRRAEFVLAIRRK